MPLTILNLNASSKSILIVDDDRIIVELLSVMFKKYGFIVFKAEDGLEAWNIFNNENIDVVLTDIRMPGLDGRELSYRIRNQSPFTKIAIMTGEESDVGTELLNDGSADYFFLKPFDIKMSVRFLYQRVMLHDHLYSSQPTDSHRSYPPSSGITN